MLTQIKANRQFCRTETAISYDYFVQSLERYTSVYIQNENLNIVGACGISLGNHITIYSICVPDGTGIGTTLLNHVKSIGQLIGAESINLTADQSVYPFYQKNGFTLRSIETEQSEPVWEYTDGHYSMTYNLEPVGGRRKKRKKPKRKRF